MDVETIASLGRECMKFALLIGAPMLTAGVVVGLIVGVFQSVTQIQDQTIAFVFKLVAIFATLAIFLPWIVAKSAEFSRNALMNIPEATTFYWK